MAQGVTDRPWQAERLLTLLARPAHVNLIPLNEVAESPLKPSTKEAVRRFQQMLERGGVTATVRRRLGPDIDAACGQLRRRELQQPEHPSRRSAHFKRKARLAVIFIKSASFARAFDTNRRRSVPTGRAP